MSENKRTIAILRGGKDDYYRSMKSGANVILSLGRYKEIVDVIDVSLDEENRWFEKGVPSDPHRVFSKADFYIDLTNNKNADYHDLSRKLSVRPVFNNDYISALNRTNIRRILNQIQIDTPKYTIIRDKKNLEHNLKEIWSKFHLPLVIKSGSHDFNEKSILTYSFVEAFDKIKEILEKGNEAVIEEHIQGKYISVAAIPEYRGENIYIPTPVEIIDLDTKKRELNGGALHTKCLMCHSHDKKSLIYIDDNTKNKIKKLVEEVYKSMFFDYHTMLDLAIIERKDKKDSIIKILDIHTSPHLFEDSRFDFILKNSGVDLGKFIIDRTEKIREQDLIY